MEEIGAGGGFGADDGGDGGDGGPGGVGAGWVVVSMVGRSRRGVEMGMRESQLVI